MQKREGRVDPYFEYPRECLKAIIYGEKMNNELMTAIRAITPDNIQLFKTRVESAKFRLVIVPLEFDDIYNRNSRSRFVTQETFEKNVLDLLLRTYILVDYDGVVQIERGIER